MSNSAFTMFVEDCRTQRAALIGLIEAYQGQRLDPGAPIEIPQVLAEATKTLVQSFEQTLQALNIFIDAWDAAAKSGEP